MSSRTGHARVVRLVPFGLGALFLLYAVAIPDPHAFNSAAVDRLTWAIGGLLMIWSGIRPQTRPRFFAMLWAVGLCVVRVTVVASYHSDLSAERIIAAAVVWTMIGLLIVERTLSAEVTDTPSRLATRE